VKDFNRRLKAGGLKEFEFPESEIPDWLPPADGRRIHQELFVAVAEGAVRGGYILKRQDFSFRGEVCPVGHYHLPLSEGLVDRTYMAVGMKLLTDALRRSAALYALGMGGFDRPLPRMLHAMGWKMLAVPFHFKVTHPFRFLRNIQPLRRSALQRAALDAAAFPGLGWAGLKVLHGWAGRQAEGLPHRLRGGAGGFACDGQGERVEIVPGFDTWADEIWERCHPMYAMAGARDGAALRILYPTDDPRFTRVAVTSGRRTVGWAVVLNTAMRNNQYFGDLRVGTIADCFAAPEDAGAVIHAASSVLAAGGVDLMISNQSHEAWCAALRAAGFRAGPSNFIFAASRKLSAMLEPWDASARRIHINRGDGDGPIHL